MDADFRLAGWLAEKWPSWLFHLKRSESQNITNIFTWKTVPPMDGLVPFASRSSSSVEATSSSSSSIKAWKRRFQIAMMMDGSVSVSNHPKLASLLPPPLLPSPSSSDNRWQAFGAIANLPRSRTSWALRVAVFGKLLVSPPPRKGCGHIITATLPGKWFECDWCHQLDHL